MLERYVLFVCLLASCYEFFSCVQDEIGIPFGVTIDVQSEKDRTVTLRERDSCAQVSKEKEERRERET